MSALMCFGVVWWRVLLFSMTEIRSCVIDLWPPQSYTPWSQVFLSGYHGNSCLYITTLVSHWQHPCFLSLLCWGALWDVSSTGCISSVHLSIIIESISLWWAPESGIVPCGFLAGLSLCFQKIRMDRCARSTGWETQSASEFLWDRTEPKGLLFFLRPRVRLPNLRYCLACMDRAQQQKSICRYAVCVCVRRRQGVCQTDVSAVGGFQVKWKRNCSWGGRSFSRSYQMNPQNVCVCLSLQRNWKEEQQCLTLRSETHLFM